MIQEEAQRFHPRRGLATALPVSVLAPVRSPAPSADCVGRVHPTTAGEQDVRGRATRMVANAFGWVLLVLACLNAKPSFATDGYRGTLWGMTEDEVRATLPADKFRPASRQESRFDRLNAKSRSYLAYTTEIAQWPATVVWIFNRPGSGLLPIGLSAVRVTFDAAPETKANELAVELEKRYGPAVTTPSNESGDGYAHENTVWEWPSEGVMMRFSFFQHTSGLGWKDVPSLFIDYDAPSRVMRRQEAYDGL